MPHIAAIRVCRLKVLDRAGGLGSAMVGIGVATEGSGIDSAVVGEGFGPLVVSGFKSC
eukprot:SAG31_NODE_676_length_12896_cov_10.122060_3_plen_58_part_00